MADLIENHHGPSMLTVSGESAARDKHVGMTGSAPRALQ